MGEHSSAVAQVSCANVLLAISSIENGDDESLVKMSVGDGEFWEPRMSAASYHLHENSFGIEQIYLDDQRDISYDVTCSISKADCENAPDSLCDAVKGSEVISSEVIFSDDDRRSLSFEDAFDDAFDGDSKIHPKRQLGHVKGNHCHHASRRVDNAWCYLYNKGYLDVHTGQRCGRPAPNCAQCTCDVHAWRCTRTGLVHSPYETCKYLNRC